MKVIILLSLAGVFGTLMRYFCVRAVNDWFPGFPWGTLAVNVAGAFIAGFCFILCRVKFQLYEEYYPVLFMGFLGAFTTFSSFALESARFVLDAQYGKFIANILLQNFSALAAVFCGIAAAKLLFR